MTVLAQLDYRERLTKSELSLSLSMEPYEINSIAWLYPDVVPIIGKICDNEFTIFGVTTYDIVGTKLNIPANGILSIRRENDTLSEWRLRSKREAIEFIEWYHNTYGAGFYYDICADKVVW
jgi:hypothetical protein